MPQSLTDVLKLVTELLVRGEYAILDRLTHGDRLSAEALARAVEEYGRTLTMPGPEAFQPDVIPVHHSAAPQWSVVIPLHTEQEGRSDLSLELTVTSTAPGSYDVRIDDLHVR